MEKKRIAICGATGQQGGGVFRKLIGSDQFEIVVITRNPDSPKAKALQDQGAALLRADLDNVSSLTEAFKGCYGVFGVTQGFSPDYKKYDEQKELKQGFAIADACAENDIQHLVFTSVFLANDREELKHMDHLRCKFEIEDYIKSKGLPFTILRPVAFMDMLGTMSFMPIKEKSTQGMVARNVRMPFVHTDDIGVLARIAFEDPEKYLGQTMDAVGDFFTGAEMAAILGKLKKVPNFKYKSAPTWLLWLLTKFGVMLDEFYRMHVMYTNWGTKPYPPRIAAAIKQMEAWNPDRITLKKYLEDFVKE